MNRFEVLDTMAAQKVGQLFRAQDLGGNLAQLRRLERHGLIQCWRRPSKGCKRQKLEHWYLTHEQHAAILADKAAKEAGR